AERGQKCRETPQRPNQGQRLGGQPPLPGQPPVGDDAPAKAKLHV
ncbi:MAG: hypothetical protein AVDCRST_MAG28-935, partial [uncultured Rubrobacteraceae bacterium]